MPCNTDPRLTPVQRKRQAEALTRLEAMIAAGTVQVAIGPQGAIAFRNWTDREGQSDVCAYRALAARNSPELRKAMVRAEAMSGRKASPQAIGAGIHSHDGGNSWHAGHVLAGALILACASPDTWAHAGAPHTHGFPLALLFLVVAVLAGIWDRKNP